MDKSARVSDNPDRLFVRAFIDERQSPRRLVGSPLADKFEITLLEAEEGRVVLGAEVDASFTQGGGVLQGGVVSTLLDFGLGLSSLSILDAPQTVATTSMTTDFLRSALPGRYRVEAEVVKKGKKVVFAKAQLVSERGDLVATASSPLIVVDLG